MNKQKKTQTSLRLNEVTLNQLRFIRDATGCSMSVILEGLVGDYTKTHMKRLENLTERRELIAAKENSMLDSIIVYENEREELLHHV